MGCLHPVLAIDIQHPVTGSFKSLTVVNGYPGGRSYSFTNIGIRGGIADNDPVESCAVKKDDSIGLVAVAFIIVHVFRREILSP